jgi:hypothetical protein
MNNHPCVFDHGSACQILKVKKCKDCKFRKNIFEWDKGRAESSRILNKKGLERVIISKGYHDIVTTKKIGGN